MYIQYIVTKGFLTHFCTNIPINYTKINFHINIYKYMNLRIYIDFNDHMQHHFS